MKKIIIFFLIFMQIFFIFNFSIYAYTIDDVREMLGKQRVDSIYTPEEIETIIMQYESLEEQNMVLRMFEIGKELGINEELDEKYKTLDIALKNARDELANSFLKGESFEIVSKKKSQVESILAEMNKLRDRGYDINIEYHPNIWKEKYIEVQKIIEELGTYYDIGDLGDGLKGPLGDSFMLLEVYGFHLDENQDLVVFHDGIDLYAKNTLRVYSQWNGVVSRVYKEENGKYVVEVQHGKNLKTIYKYFDSVDVEEGDFVKQYGFLGILGQSQENEEADGFNLHFSVYLDNESINPLYLYGDMGLRTFKTFVSSKPERYLEYYEVEKNIVEIEKEDNEGNEVKEENVDYNREEIFNNFQHFQEELEKNKNKVKLK